MTSSYRAIAVEDALARIRPLLRDGGPRLTQLLQQIEDCADGRVDDVVLYRAEAVALREAMRGMSGALIEEREANHDLRATMGAFKASAEAKLTAYEQLHRGPRRDG